MNQFRDGPACEGFTGPAVKLLWESEPPPDRENVEAAVRADLARNIRGVAVPGGSSLLVFHHVFLTDSLSGPSVFVYGKDGSDAYHCKYDEKTVWMTVDADGNRVKVEPA